MGQIIRRELSIQLPTGQSAFLWGPRKTGKTHWVTREFPESILIDLLKTDTFAEYAVRPALLRERFGEQRGLVIIDEIQMVPDILNEVHWLIENRGVSFLMTGSSARKLRRNKANLLGGRAWRYTMAPLTYSEVDGFELESVMVSGLLPPHFLASNPIQHLRSYVADYLKEEIAAEASVQSMPRFAEFLRVASLTTGELLNYTNVGRECGVSAKVVRGYFQILEDTLLGFTLQPWRKAKTRRMIETAKFYLFDVGVSNYLARRRPAIGTPEFGKSFEQFILMELKAYQAYRNPELDLYFWRTSTGLEVDFILGAMEVAIEVKGSARVHKADFKGLKALCEEQEVNRTIVVSLESAPRKTESGIEVLPWQHFLELLWSGELGA